MARKPSRPDKRTRLADAAVALAYEHGFGPTTLADIARQADVPLGNVYYYFKTKEDFGTAIIERRRENFRALRDRLDALPTPRQRLAAFVDRTVANRDNVARLGCPVGSLCAELLKTGGPLGERSRLLFAEPMAWMEEQFRGMGRQDAAGLALQLQASLQGASLLAHSLRDPELMTTEGHRLQTWLQSLEAEADRPPPPASPPRASRSGRARGRSS